MSGYRIQALYRCQTWTGVSTPHDVRIYQVWAEDRPGRFVLVDDEVAAETLMAFGGVWSVDKAERVALRVGLTEAEAVEYEQRHHEAEMERLTREYHEAMHQHRQTATWCDVWRHRYGKARDEGTR